MKKKWLIVLFALVGVIACAFGLAGCGEKPGGGNKNQGTTQAPSNENNATGEDESHTHALTLVDAKPADCEMTGNTAYYTCSCGKWFFDSNATSEITDKGSVEIEATGHSYSDEWTSSETKHWHKATCAHAMLTSAAQNHTFENNICTICKYNNDLISFKTLEVSDDTAHGKVANATVDFSFIKEVTVNGGATFTVATDKACREVIPSKTVDLQVGDNVFYILAERGEIIKLFTVILRRRPIHTVAFENNGGFTLPSQTVEEDGILVEEPEIPNKCGYSNSGWEIDGIKVKFPFVVTKGTILSVSYIANKYTVTLDSEGFEEIDATTATVTFDEKSTLPVPTSSKSWLFTGWYLDETQLTDESGNLLSVWTIPDNITLKSKKETIFILDNGTITGIVEKAKDFTEIVIPEIDVLEITAIGRNAFRKCSVLISIIIPDSITEIGYGAFAECTSLISITIPYRVTVIESFMFYRCSSLQSVAIPNGVTRLFAQVFDSCSSLKNLHIPDSVTDFNLYTFDGSSFERITVGLNNSVYSSYDGIIYNKSKTEIVHVPRNITGHVTLPYGIKNIRSSAFSGRSGLTSITIPDSVTSIGELAFHGCSGLTSIIIPDSVTYIYGYAFDSCSSLAIYCEAIAEPIGWDKYWNPSNRPVVWDYKNDID